MASAVFRYSAICNYRLLRRLTVSAIFLRLDLPVLLPMMERFFNGVGTLSAATIRSSRHRLDLLVREIFLPTLLRNIYIQVRFAGAGNLSADSIKYKIASAFFNGVGNLSVAYSIVKYGEIRLEGSSNLRVGTISRMQASAIFNGQGSLQAVITGGRGPRLPTRGGISGETVATRASGSVPRRSDQFEPIRSPSTMPRRQKNTHG